MNKGLVIPILASIAIGLCAWMWSLYSELHSRSTLQEKQVAVLEASKADRSELSEVRIGLAKQTAILESQSTLMGQQYELIKSLVEKS